MFKTRVRNQMKVKKNSMQEMKYQEHKEVGMVVDMVAVLELALVLELELE